MRRNHWSSSRSSTLLWQRQHSPPSACSLASTVWHDGHQLTAALLAVGDAPLEHAQEEPLVPAVVLGVAGGDLAAPGVAEAQPLELALHARDVLARPLLGVDAALDGGVLRGQAEGVPADGVQDVEAAHPLVAGHHVGDAVVADVADVDVARGVGQHLQAVELRPRAGPRVTSKAPRLRPRAAASASRSRRSRSRSWSASQTKGAC